MSVQRITSNLAPQPNGADDKDFSGSCYGLENQNAFLQPSAHHDAWNAIEYGISGAPGIPAVSEHGPEANPPSESLRG